MSGPKDQRAEFRATGLPDSYTAVDNELLDSATFKALAKANPRAAILLLYLNRMRWRGDKGRLHPGGLELNGKLSLPRKKVAPLMCKEAQRNATGDLIYCGFVRETAPARPPEVAARLLIVDNCDRWQPPKRQSKAKRSHRANGTFQTKAESAAHADTPNTGKEHYTGPQDRPIASVDKGPSNGPDKGPSDGPITGHETGRDFSAGGVA